MNNNQTIYEQKQTTGKIVYLSKGHQMNEETYKKKSAFYSNLITTFKGEVLLNKPPVVGISDYSYVVKGLKQIPKELHTAFAQAGVVAKVANYFRGYIRIDLYPR